MRLLAAVVVVLGLASEHVVAQSVSTDRTLRVVREDGGISTFEPGRNAPASVSKLELEPAGAARVFIDAASVDYTTRTLYVTPLLSFAQRRVKAFDIDTLAERDVFPGASRMIVPVAHAAPHVVSVRYDLYEPDDRRYMVSQLADGYGNPSYEVRDRARTHVVVARKPAGGRVEPMFACHSSVHAGFVVGIAKIAPVEGGDLDAWKELPGATTLPLPVRAEMPLGCWPNGSIFVSGYARIDESRERYAVVRPLPGADQRVCDTVGESDRHAVCILYANGNGADADVALLDFDEQAVAIVDDPLGNIAAVAAFVSVGHSRSRDAWYLSDPRTGRDFEASLGARLFRVTLKDGEAQFVELEVGNSAWAGIVAVIDEE